ncbi:hypothetical protein ALC53_11965 [Atta colombica]|uniref:Uncharacterized protein n=1 Tax=Atta colombica TaxID=520822 RepID=A0A195B092_9HYME|nr:hypothetical protein ALC53_11965 [Atta colombica]
MQFCITFRTHRAVVPVMTATLSRKIGPPHERVKSAWLVTYSGNCRLRLTACPSASTAGRGREEWKRSDRERRNGTAVRFEKAENRAVRDAVPEIYGSPDNEGDSSASVMASVTLTGLLCLQPAYSLRTVLIGRKSGGANPGWSAFLNNRASETLDISSEQRTSHAAKRLLATHEYNMGINKSKQAY